MSSRLITRISRRCTLPRAFNKLSQRMTNTRLISHQNRHFFASSARFQQQDSNADEPLDIQKELEKAFKQNLEKAEEGDTEAMVELSVQYLSGTGVEKDVASATKWMRQAADAGNSKAMCMMGVILENGMYGEEADPAKAMEFYRRAADAGNPDALVDIGRAYFNGHGVEKDLKEAFKAFEQAAEHGNPEGLFWTGAMYEMGETVGRDMEKALDYYHKARDAGDELATYRLEALERLQKDGGSGTQGEGQA